MKWKAIKANPITGVLTFLAVSAPHKLIIYRNLDGAISAYRIGNDDDTDDGKVSDLLSQERWEQLYNDTHVKVQATQALLGHVADVEQEII